jgi:hypothetical protein
MKIVVTKEHWDRGVEVAFPIMRRRLTTNCSNESGPSSVGWQDGYCEHCVLAQAFKDAGFKDVMVNTNIAHLDGKRYVLPMDAVTTLRNFDRYETLTRLQSSLADVLVPKFPFSFELGSPL